MSERACVRVTHLDGNGTWLLVLEGEHDIATIPLLDHETFEVWPRCTVAIVDLSAVTFMDCSVVAWLIRTRGAIAASSTAVDSLRIVTGTPTPVVRRVFEVLRLQGELACFASLGDARSSRDELGSPLRAGRSHMQPQDSHPDRGSRLYL